MLFLHQRKRVVLFLTLKESLYSGLTLLLTSTAIKFTNFLAVVGNDPLILFNTESVIPDFLLLGLAVYVYLKAK